MAINTYEGHLVKVRGVFTCSMRRAQFGFAVKQILSVLLSAQTQKHLWQEGAQQVLPWMRENIFSQRSICVTTNKNLEHQRIHYNRSKSSENEVYLPGAQYFIGAQAELRLSVSVNPNPLHPLGGLVLLPWH